MTTDDSPYGFWSYVHADDDAEDGRILRLGERIKNEYEMITGGETIEIFVDRKDITWGKKWRQTIDNALTETAFFIPVVTARYVQRPECRRELLLFSANAEQRGVPELILPLLYLPVPGLHEDSQDEVKATLAATQYFDWTQLRFEDEQSTAYRVAVNSLALRLAEIAKEISARPEVSKGQGSLTSVAAADVGTELDDDAPGILDAMADAEAEFPDWVATIKEYMGAVNSIGELFTEYTPKMTKAGNAGSGAKLLVAKRLANELDPLADSLRNNGIEYLEQAMSLNGNITTILSQIAHSGVSGSERDSFSGFGQALREMATNGREAIQAVESFQTSADDVGRMSKDIRRPLRKVSEGAQSFIDGQRFFDDWVRRLDDIEAGL